MYVSLGTRKRAVLPCIQLQRVVAMFSFRSDAVSSLLSAVTITIFPGKTGQTSSLASRVGAQLTAICSCQPLEPKGAGSHLARY